MVELLSIVITEKNVECPPKKTVKLSQKNQRYVQKKLCINVGSVLKCANIPLAGPSPPGS